MKNKFSIFTSKLFHYFKQILGNKYPDSKSQVKKNKVVVEDNLRWQDDGGPVVDVANPIDPVPEDDPAKPANVTRDASLKNK